MLAVVELGGNQFIVRVGEKRHMKNNGFRPHLTKLEVLSIG